MTTPKKTMFCRAAVLALSCIPVASFAMNITFVGDSITQGGLFNAGNVASYRYSLFKNFVDNNIAYNPMGMTQGAAKNVDVSSLTPVYRGFTFENVSEAAASGRSYQYAGHEQSAGYRGDPGVVFPIENCGPVSVKLGLENPFTGTTNTFYDGDALKTYAGDTYQSLYGDRKVETLCVMIGINDLYDGNSNESISTHVHNIVKAYQAHNPNIRVHLFELLPTAKDNGTGTNRKNNYFSYNEHLRAVGGTWSTATSVVTVDNIATGFYAESGAMVDTAAGAHPNAQGELIVAGNIARVLGIGQRNAGLERRGNTELSSRVHFSAGASGGVQVKANVDAQEKAFSQSGSGFSVNEAGNLQIKTALSGSNDLSLTWNDTGTAREFTAMFSLKMTKTGNAQNGFGIILGNGVEAGVLYVREYGIFWNQTLLYGSDTIGDTTHNTFDATTDFNDFTVSWIDESSEVLSGFYVWLGDQLIGESLQSFSEVSSHKNKILFGDIGSSWLTDAELSALSFDAGTAWAPMAIPEPATFGFFAGIGLLAFAASRRRRK